MSILETITRRSAFAMQGMATIGASPEWDAAVSRYFAAEALYFADTEFGRRHEADEEFAITAMRLNSEYGREYRSNPVAAELYGAARERQRAAEDEQDAKYLHPFWQAARSLAVTRAPTLAAAVFKLAVIHADELWNDSKFEEDCMALIEADFARLAA